MICYKIGIHNKLVDLNAFSPRDYKQVELRLFQHLAPETHSNDSIYSYLRFIFVYYHFDILYSRWMVST